MPARTQWRRGGEMAIAARALTKAWLAAGVSAEDLQAATSHFLTRMLARSTEQRAAPSWAGEVTAAMEQVDTRGMARSLSLHPAWLARAYRAWRGEGLVETARRLRVERAALLLRGACAPLVDVALAAGFCDQSHMNRAFRAVLGRTPLEVRREAALLAPITQSA
jgi:AraC family transcriptional regulator